MLKCRRMPGSDGGCSSRTLPLPGPAYKTAAADVQDGQAPSRVETMQTTAVGVQLIGRRRRRLTHRLPPWPELLAPARLGSGAAAPSPLLALTGGPNSLFIHEESTLKRESIFLSSV